MSLAFAFTGVQLSLSGTFRGAGDMTATLLLSAVGAWLVLLPIATMLARHTPLGVTGVWIAYPVAGAINTAIALAYYRYGRWRRIRLTAERRLESQVSAEILIEEGQS
jgi:Na+-driven multidrug efflux pump